MKRNGSDLDVGGRPPPRSLCGGIFNHRVVLFCPRDRFQAPGIAKEPCLSQPGGLFFNLMSLSCRKEANIMEQRKSPRVVFERGFAAHMMAIDGTWRAVA